MKKPEFPTYEKEEIKTTMQHEFELEFTKQQKKLL